MAMHPTILGVAYVSLELAVQVSSVLWLWSDSPTMFRLRALKDPFQVSLQIQQLSFDGSTGTLATGATYPLLPPDFRASTVGQSAAEVIVSPDGRFVYVSVRGRAGGAAPTWNGVTGA